MIAETFSGVAEGGAAELSHNILHLNRLDRDAFCQFIIQASASRGSEAILRVVRRTAPRVGATEKELHVRRPFLPVAIAKPRSEKIGKCLVIDSLPGIGVTTEVCNQSNSFVQVIDEIS